MQNHQYYPSIYQLRHKQATCCDELSGSSALSCSDIQNLGVNLLGHQRKIASAAQQLRAHLTQGQVKVWNPPTEQPVLWISKVFTFLCLLCLVSAAAFIFMEHILKPKPKKSACLSMKCHFIFLKPDMTNTRWWKGGSDFFPASHSRQIKEERCTLGAAVEVRVRLGFTEEKKDFSRFLNVFH